MPDKPQKKSTQVFLRSLFAIAALMFAVCVVLLPWALESVIDDVTHPPSEHKYPFTPEGIQPAASYTQLHVDVVGLDEVNRQATLRVNGFHSCDRDCGAYKERVIFYQVDEDDSHADSLPPSEAVVLPSTAAEITSKISLPIRGSLMTYPFDRYKLGLGVVLEREYPDKTVKVLTPAETRGQLLMTFQEQVPRVDLAEIKSVDAKVVKPKKAPFDYAYVKEVTFERPPYLKLVVSLVAVLSIAVTIFTMSTRPFDQLVINAGALIFGIWGIRSLVLGGYPADVTLLDTILTGIVVFMLLALTFRGMNYFHRTGKLHLLPWAKPEEKKEEKKPEPPTRECPECLSKVPLAAKRCAFCTSPLPGMEETGPAGAGITKDGELVAAQN